MSFFDEAEFTELVTELVADEAPRLFAVVHELGDRDDGRIAGWGMAFEDHTAVMCNGSSSWLNVSSPDRARRLLDQSPRLTAHLVWVTPTDSR